MSPPRGGSRERCHRVFLWVVLRFNAPIGAGGGQAAAESTQDDHSSAFQMISSSYLIVRGRATGGGTEGERRGNGLARQPRYNYD
jgi:hypothetical protein